ncbi:unnamed protein product [Gongylonema pulchrum]|uniref:RDD domain-containing protein n=1 Tax=Gongylonema pulchrum TaxID=637853 RepID=A0A183EGP4_9BILA|nr:unnamed protein product [Gongylonema pulchrum]
MKRVVKRKSGDAAAAAAAEGVAASAAVSPVIEYGSAGAYACELRKWLFATQCWTFCHQMATMHSLCYLASCMQQQQHPPMLLPSAAVPAAAAEQQQRQFVQRCQVPSFTRRIVAELIDSVFAFSAKLFVVYFLVEMAML